MILNKLIPAALLALAGAAQAQVSVYGLVDAGVVKSLTDDAEGENATLRFGGNSSTRVGLKGSNEVAPGVKANFQLESSAISIDGELAGDILFGRQAWAGFSGSLGEVRVGRQDSVGNQTLLPFDLNAAGNTSSASDAVGIISGLFNGQGTRSLQYIAPVVSGFKLQLGYQSPADADGKASTSIGATYTLDALSVAVAASSETESGGETAAALAAGYDFGVLKAVFSYSGTVGAKGAMVGFVVPVSGFNLGVQYAVNSESKAKATELFVNKEIFKGTYAYADVVSKRDGARTDAYAIGVIYTF